MNVSAVTLEGRHARLEPLHERHLTALFRHAADAEIWRWMPVPRDSPETSLRSWYERARAGAARGDMMPWAIVDRATGEAIGGTTYLDIAPADKRVEIGATWHGKAFWRTAVNTECKFLLLRHAFEMLGCNRVQLKTDLRNERSQAAIARLGAQREGVLRAHMIMPDGWVRDSVMFSILAAEWPAVKKRLEQLMNR